MHTHIIQPYVQVQPCKSRNSVPKSKCVSTLVGGAAVEVAREARGMTGRTPIPVEMKMK